MQAVAAAISSMFYEVRLHCGHWCLTGSPQPLLARKHFRLRYHNVQGYSLLFHTMGYRVSWRNISGRIISGYRPRGISGSPHAFLQRKALVINHMPTSSSGCLCGQSNRLLFRWIVDVQQKLSLTLFQFHAQFLHNVLGVLIMTLQRN